MYNLIKPFLFKKDPEEAHYYVAGMMKRFFKWPLSNTLASAMWRVNDKRLETKVFGLTFPNPVGLAAGFDKDAKMFDELSRVGFGFIEIGTLTPVGQTGNAKPRLFRLVEDEAIINRMGFNNEGVVGAVERLKKKRPGILIGGNIGKNKVTPNEEAWLDYEKCFEALHAHVDYFVVNVSSPNTPGLRALQDKEPLIKLLVNLKELNQQKDSQKPILLKIAPDLNQEQLDDIVEVVKTSDINGVIATNTTVDWSGLKSSDQRLDEIRSGQPQGPGGLSGKPVKSKSTEVIRYLHGKLGEKYPIIGVGGIHSAEDAMEKLKAGASLVQLYTGFIYEGPALIKRINKAIIRDRS